MTYAQDLLHPKWQKKRLKIFERDKFTCQMCHSKIKTLSIHHKEYLKGKKPWEHPNRLLITLCQPCHEIAGSKLTLKKKLSSLEARMTKKFNRKLSREIDLVVSLLEAI
jgi:5-methylcytosine-specific restriction endonuclease McrA